MAMADVEMAPGDTIKQPSASQAEEEDLYIKLKTLQRNMEFLEIQVCIRLLPCAPVFPTSPAAVLLLCFDDAWASALRSLAVCRSSEQPLQVQSAALRGFRPAIHPTLA
jgi:hypothetical protein